MKKKNTLLTAIFILTLFVLFTALLQIVDVRAIGPRNSVVGMATINRFVHNLTGVNLTLYNITDWLGLVPLLFAVGFAFLGLVQLIKRRKLLKVDYSILILGGFYIVTMLAYVFFEKVVINYRPTLINGYLEVSYPSSTTLLVMCVMPTSIMQLKSRIKNKKFENLTTISITIFIAFMVVARLISGVHWLTDIIGGALLSTGLVIMYYSISNFKQK